MTDYDFIDPDQPERKREVQRRVEAQENSSSNTSRGNSEANTDKVRGEDGSIVNRLKTAIGGFLQ